MKMISSTNSTSTRGVTLMSDIAPLLEPDAKAMVQISSQCSFLATKPTLRMPWACAIFTTSLTIRYLVVWSPRTLTCGCGVFWASIERRLSSRSRVIGSSFQYNEPFSWIATVIGGIFASLVFSSRLASGSLTWILCVISGAVIMKMINNTNITSTRGVTLISAIGPPLSLPELKAIVRTPTTRRRRRYCGLALASRFADARTGGEEVVQVVREGVELVVRDTVQTHEEVVRKHRRDGDEQTDGGHDQRFTHRAGDGLDRRFAAGAEAQQCVVDAPHGAEQTDERSGRTDGGEHGQATLELHRLAGDGLTQGTVNELRAVQRLDQARTFMALVVSGSLGGVERDLRERLAAALLFHEADRVLRVRGFPERADHAVRVGTQTHVLDEVHDDPVDRQNRHDGERDEHDPADEVKVLQQMREAHLLEGFSVRAPGSSGGGGFLQHDAYLWISWKGKKVSTCCLELVP